MQLKIRTKDYWITSQGQLLETVIENNVIEAEASPETMEPSEIEVTVSNNREQEYEANPASGQDPPQQSETRYSIQGIYARSACIQGIPPNL